MEVERAKYNMVEEGQPSLRNGILVIQAFSAGETTEVSTLFQKFITSKVLQ